MSIQISRLEHQQRSRHLKEIRSRHHVTCAVCNVLNDQGLGADFVVDDCGVVEASVLCGGEKEGYSGMVHGGILASLLDGAMTNCLFSYGIVAVTGELRVKYLHGVSSGVKIVARAWLQTSHPPLYKLQAEICQRNTVTTCGSAKFMDMQHLKKTAPEALGTKR